MVGNHSRLSRKDLNDSIEKLLVLQSETHCKFFLSAFPYGSNLSDTHNKCIHRMNSHLFTLTNRHSDDILFFDINNLNHNITITQDTLYVSRKFKRQLATLVAYNIHSFLTLVSKNTNIIIPFLN